MLKIKQFSDKQVIFVDDKTDKEYVLTCKNDTERFDLDIIEDIIDWDWRQTKKEMW